MKNNLVTYWTVEYIKFGMQRKGIKFYKNYKNAKAESMRDYHDKPVKHTVRPEYFPPEYVFED